MAMRWELTPERLKRIEELAALGVREDSIARQVGLHPSTFSEKKKIHPEIAEVINNAQACTEEIVVSALMNMIKDPKHKAHAAAVFFYLKTKCRWQETSVVITAEKPSSLKYNVVAPMDEENAA